MAGETPLTIIGNLTADPELRFTPGGDGVANFTVASTPRTFDRTSNEWKDGETLFMRCAAWRELSENVAESLLKGMRVIVTGRLKSRSFETKEGEKRTVIELEVDEVGPSLRYATAQVTRTQRNGNGQGGQPQGQGGGFGGQQGGFNNQGFSQPPAQQGAQQGGNWGAQPGGQQAGGWGGQTAAAQGGQHNVAHYQQAAANGPGQAPQNTLQEDPWATPGGQTQPPVQQGQPGGWGGQPQGQQGGQQNEPPF
jgi:single-strand DNA-binding protein